MEPPVLLTSRTVALCCLVIAIPALTTRAQPNESNGEEKLPGPLFIEQPTVSAVQAHESRLGSRLLSEESDDDSGVRIQMRTISVSEKTCPPVDKFAIAQPLRYERPSSIDHNVDYYFPESDSLVRCAVHSFSPGRSPMAISEALEEGGNVQKWTKEGTSAFRRTLLCRNRHEG